MGREVMTITIRGSRSSHNSLQEYLDTTKWKYLREKIDEILDRDDYDSLDIVVDGPEER